MTYTFWQSWIFPISELDNDSKACFRVCDHPSSMENSCQLRTENDENQGKDQHAEAPAGKHLRFPQSGDEEQKHLENVGHEKSIEKDKVLHWTKLTKGRVPRNSNAEMIIRFLPSLRGGL